MPEAAGSDQRRGPAFGRRRRFVRCLQPTPFQAVPAPLPFRSGSGGARAGRRHSTGRRFAAGRARYRCGQRRALRLHDGCLRSPSTWTIVPEWLNKSARYAVVWDIQELATKTTWTTTPTSAIQTTTSTPERTNPPPPPPFFLDTCGVYGRPKPCRGLKSDRRRGPPKDPRTGALTAVKKNRPGWAIVPLTNGPVSRSCAGFPAATRRAGVLRGVRRAPASRGRPEARRGRVPVRAGPGARRGPVLLKRAPGAGPRWAR